MNAEVVTHRLWFFDARRVFALAAVAVVALVTAGCAMFVNEAHAINPFVQLARLTASNGIGGQYVGEDVASSADGSTLVVAGPNQGPGTAYVFVRPTGGWADMTETVPLTVPDNHMTDDASSVAISANGDTILIGVVNQAIYVYKRGPGGWSSSATLAAVLKPSGAAGGFADSIGISGETIVSGARSTTIDHEYQGAVYVYAEPVGGWQNATETARLTASDDATFDSLGASVGIDGNTIAASAYGHDGSHGALYVFTRPSGGWVSGTQTAELTTPSAEYLGNTPYSVAISGSTIVAGSRQFTVGENTAQGAAFVWTMPSGGWHDLTSATAQLTAFEPFRYDYVGRSVAIYGTTIVLGAAEVESNKQQGAAYVYTEPASGWADMTETQKLTASDATNGADFGSSVAVGANTILVGAEFAGGPGKAYVFAGPPAEPTVLSAAATGVNGTQATLNGSVNPNGALVSDCHFEWGTTTAYGQSLPCVTPPGTGAEPVAVSASLSGLAPGATYHFRLVATGPGGTSYGTDEQLTTAAGEVLGTQETSPAKSVTTQTTQTPQLLPSTRTCVSARSFVIHIGLEHATRLHILSARVTVGGRLVARVKPGHLTVRIDLRGVPQSTVKVHIVAHVRGGGTITGTRTYHTCATSRLAAKKHVL
jgi:hypothetical protein